MKHLILLGVVVLFVTLGCSETTQKNTNTANAKVLFVITNHTELGNTGEKTGFFLGELTHPLHELQEAGIAVHFISPQGGKVEAYGVELTDEINKKYWHDPEFQKALANTRSPKQINLEDYQGVFYVGGHGAMWDFPNHIALEEVTRIIYERGGVVSGVCHGVSALINVRLSNDKILLEGKKVTGFTNEEEVAVNLEKVVPFLLEDVLKAQGAIFEKAGLWRSYVVTDGRIITGQNPQSARGVGQAIVKALKN